MFDKLQSNLIIRILSLSLSMAVLTGCSLSWPLVQDPVAESSTEGQITSLGLEPNLDYDKPSIDAHIEIDQMGYRPEGKKLAVFRGEELSDKFNVLNEDGDIVFTGEIKEKRVSGSNVGFYYGDFTELTNPGTYYIQTDVIGYSYPFKIEEGMVRTLQRDALKQFYLNRCGVSLTEEYAGTGNERSACHTEAVTLKTDASTQLDVSGGWHVDASGDRSVAIGCEAIEAMLLAYEYNTDAFSDNTGIPESGDGIPDILNEIKVETDWLLKMQEPTTGAVYAAVSVVDQDKGTGNPCHVENVDMSSTLSFASALGYFSYLYQEYDTVYATMCLQAADRAMKYAAKYPDTINQEEYFKAATMLYRATGYYNYRQIIAAYCEGKNDYIMSDNDIFVGVVTYLATKQRTDITICDTMMKALKKYAETLDADRKDTLYLMGEETRAVEHTTLLSEIARLTVVNYIISSNEYQNIMERYLHYFMGCNPDNTCYVGQYGSVNACDTDASMDITRKPELDALFLILVSGLEDE